MAIRDLIVPAFLSTSTVSAIVLRGLSANPDVEGTGTGLVTFENEDLNYFDNDQRKFTLQLSIMIVVIIVFNGL